MSYLNSNYYILYTIGATYHEAGCNVTPFKSFAFPKSHRAFRCFKKCCHQNKKSFEKGVFFTKASKIISAKFFSFKDKKVNALLSKYPSSIFLKYPSLAWLGQLMATFQKRAKRQPNPTRTCSYFTHEAVLVLPDLATG